MYASRRDIGPFSGIALALLIASASPLWTGTAASGPAPDSEAARIQLHLQTVENELRRRDVSGLAPRQQAARAEHIRVLREYRQQGIFPHNHDFADRQLPYFVDHQGTHCAVAYLIARSGRTDLVERVARARNNAYVPQLADDPELLAWLDSAGLSLQEATRIQPSYGWSPSEQAEQGVSSEYALLSALSIGFGGVSIATNWPGNREAGGWRGAYGLLIGAYGIALGAPKLDADGTSQLLGVLNTAVGATSALLGARTLWQGAARRRSASHEQPAAPVPVTITASPVVRESGRAGIMVQVKY